MTDPIKPPVAQFLREDTIRGGMDLLLLANVHHLRRADARLALIGMGRAHHRVLWFVARKPGMPVSELLSFLGITKQSFGRVSNELVCKGLIEMRPGERDRRQRLIHLTPLGAELERELFDELHDNMLRAYSASGGEAVQGFWIVLQHFIGDAGLEQFKAVNDAADPQIQS